MFTWIWMSLSTHTHTFPKIIYTRLDTHMFPAAKYLVIVSQPDRGRGGEGGTGMMGGTRS